ncbi:MAG: MFS transporter [Bacteroidia bacterium]|jgi:MFS family permease|nr:MFS transporter [Bacteroidota bacterium]MBP6511748.1 MFS transporter [Bacteroidia bacterium]MBP7244615.1 MFS transporter [Bacteroidia bacterium]
MQKKHDPFESLRYRDFRFFLSGKLLLTIALQMQAIVASWMIYDQTKDPFALGLIGLTEAIPALSLALPGGFLADRYNRKKLMLVSVFMMLLASTGLVYYALSDFQTLGTWPAYLVIFFIGLARGFFNPAQSAFWAQLVPNDKYINASVWNSSLWQVGAVTGPALGGLAYGWYGPAITSAAVCVLMVVVFFSYLLIRHQPMLISDRSESMRASLKTGIQFFFKQQLLLSAVSLDLFAVLFGGAVALLPAFADQILHTGPEGLGFLRSAPAIGAVIMAAKMAFRPPAKGAGKLMLWCVAGFGLCMIAFALSQSFLFSMFVLILSGMLDNVSVVIRSTILQTYTPNEMRGRVSAVNSIFVGSSNEIGAFESGLAAKYLGLVNSVVLGGCLTLGVVGITWKTAPKLRDLDL